MNSLDTIANKLLFAFPELNDKIFVTSIGTSIDILVPADDIFNRVYTTLDGITKPELIEIPKTVVTTANEIIGNFYSFYIDGIRVNLLRTSYPDENVDTQWSL